jgi:hypothetical protein
MTGLMNCEDVEGSGQNLIYGFLVEAWKNQGKSHTVSELTFETGTSGT